MLSQRPTGNQPKYLTVVAERAFRLVEREQVNDTDSVVTGYRIVQPGETVNVDRTLGLELIANFKAHEQSDEEKRSTKAKPAEKSAA